MPVAPATIVRTKRSWPGTSTTDSAPPAGQRRAARSRARSRSRARAPRAAGRCRRPSARGSARSCRGRCGRRCRASAAAVSGTLARARPRAPRPRARRRPACAGPAAAARPRSARPPAARPPAARAASASGRRRRPRTTGPGSSSSGSAPPPTRAVEGTTSAPAIGAASRARPRRELLLGGAQHRQHRDLPPRPLRVAVEPQRRLQRGEPSLSSRSARASGCARARADRVRAADDQPRLRPAEQLVAARSTPAPRPRRTERRTGGSSASSGEIVGEHARADVVDHRHAELAQLLDLDLLHEAELAEVRRVRAQDRAGRSPIARS